MQHFWGGDADDVADDDYDVGTAVSFGKLLPEAQLSLEFALSVFFLLTLSF
ncbi:MAG: hypothetical protein R3D55_16870 [Chloroflexota bacterium]